MTTQKLSSEGTVVLRYESIRNLTSPEEKESGAKSYFANIPVPELLKLDTEANLRSYVPEHPGKRRSQVHVAIGDTLSDRPERFIQLSSGITVCATDISIDDDKKLVRIKRGSIINGAQTQGEIRRYLSDLNATNEYVPEFHARVEFIIDPDHEFIVETAIARNTSTNIQRLSMAGKKQYFEQLDVSFKKKFPKLDLSRSETDIGDQYVDTLKLLQGLWVMMPEKLLPQSKRNVAQARLKSYKNRAYCLVDFENDFIAKDKSENDDERKHATQRYKYFIDMAGVGWEEYLKWRHHQKWHGKYLKETSRQVVRAEGEVTVSDGVVFPILAAMSQFVIFDKSNKCWRLDVPGIFDEEEMIDAARDQLTSHQGSPMLMGRDASVYDTLSVLPRMVLRFTGRIEARRG